MSLTREGLRRGARSSRQETKPRSTKSLGLQYIELELREGLDEIERAAAHSIPPLVAAADLLGVLHAHTTVVRGNQSEKTLDWRAATNNPTDGLHDHHNAAIMPMPRHHASRAFSSRSPRYTTASDGADTLEVMAEAKADMYILEPYGCAVGAEVCHIRLSVIADIPETPSPRPPFAHARAG